MRLVFAAVALLLSGSSTAVNFYGYGQKTPNRLGRGVRVITFNSLTILV